MINLSLVGERLKEQRKALKLSQADIAELVGVTREHWGRCERGAAMPGGEVLAALAGAGADVRYVLTGSTDAAAGFRLSAEEQTLVQYFRGATKEVQRAVMGALLGVAMAPGAGGMSNSGAGAVQVGQAGGKVVVKKGR